MWGWFLFLFDCVESVYHWIIFGPAWHNCFGWLHRQYRSLSIVVLGGEPAPPNRSGCWRWWWSRWWTAYPRYRPPRSSAYRIAVESMDFYHPTTPRSMRSWSSMIPTYQLSHSTYPPPSNWSRQEIELCDHTWARVSVTNEAHSFRLVGRFGSPKMVGPPPSLHPTFQIDTTHPPDLDGVTFVAHSWYISIAVPDSGSTDLGSVEDPWYRTPN